MQATTYINIRCLITGVALAILHSRAIFDFLDTKKRKKKTAFVHIECIGKQIFSGKHRHSRFARARDEGHLFENPCLCFFSTGRRQKSFLAAFNSRGKKLISIRPVEASATRETRPVLRAGLQVRYTQGLVYSTAWFIRTGAVCAWYIFIVKTVADNLEYVFSHGCTSLVPARSYLTSVRPSVHLSHTPREECTLRFA